MQIHYLLPKIIYILKYASVSIYNRSEIDDKIIYVTLLDKESTSETATSGRAGGTDRGRSRLSNCNT